jgi:hypothetical protein
MQGRGSRQGGNPAVSAQIGARAQPAGVGAVEAAVQRALPSGNWVMERVDIDTVRYRQGSQCVVVRRSRSEAVDPINSQGMGGKPWVASPPEAC